MYFDEGRPLNRPHNSDFETSSRIGSAKQQPNPSTHYDAPEAHPVFGQTSLQSSTNWKAGGALNAANNKLQELMQLFYLLSRDPAIPADARYHVTVAQSEIALLMRLMQNVANPGAGEGQTAAQGDTFASR
ncbi:MAG: hypothetical protein WCC87_16665 [Candidatus Korobacteraceae bacterium]